MAIAVDRDLARLTGDGSEDTVDLELCPEQALVLARAAEEQQVVTSPVPSDRPALLPVLLPARGAVRTPGAVRLSTVLVSFFAGVIVAAAVVAVWELTHRATALRAPAPTAVINGLVLTAPAPTAAVDSPDPPVRFTNPFDRSEVFEFPPGTSQAEARQAAAERLLQRARERWTEATRTNHAAGGDRANLSRKLSSVK